MEWVLVICTQGWLMCGQIREDHYPTEASCYRAMKSLYEHSDREDFKYVICKPDDKGDTDGK